MGGLVAGGGGNRVGLRTEDLLAVSLWHLWNQAPTKPWEVARVCEDAGDTDGNRASWLGSCGGGRRVGAVAGGPGPWSLCRRVCTEGRLTARECCWRGGEAAAWRAYVFRGGRHTRRWQVARSHGDWGVVQIDVSQSLVGTQMDTNKGRPLAIRTHGSR